MKDKFCWIFKSILRNQWRKGHWPEMLTSFFSIDATWRFEFFQRLCFRFQHQQFYLFSNNGCGVSAGKRHWDERSAVILLNGRAEQHASFKDFLKMLDCWKKVHSGNTLVTTVWAMWMIFACCPHPHLPLKASTQGLSARILLSVDTLPIECPH